MPEAVLLERKDEIAIVTMNRPEALNAVDDAMRDGLVKALTALAGAGGHFMAGGDIKNFARFIEESPEARRRRFAARVPGIHPIVHAIRAMPAPVVASVRGAAAGFGMSLLMACDLAIAAEDAYFTIAYSRLGLTPDGGGTYHLPRLVGMKKALELALLAERFDAATALALGFVNRVVPAAALEAETMALAARLASGPTRAYGRTKRLLNRAFAGGLEEQLAAEAESFADCAASEDFAEGVRAFIDKRKPRFSGR
jgi:2-(1,2-epoxy-1,2-dihydrophenyl)acetyl-CoA isomerase